MHVEQVIVVFLIDIKQVSIQSPLESEINCFVFCGLLLDRYIISSFSDTQPWKNKEGKKENQELIPSSIRRHEA